MTNHLAHTPDLEATVYRAAVRLQRELACALPRTSPSLRRWLGGSPELFAQKALSPAGFPSLALPGWITTEAERRTAIGFHDDVAFSTINGFCFVRLVDDVADRDHGDDRRGLLATLGFFHARFQAAYQHHFPFGHRFWGIFQSTWDAHAEATGVDRHLADVTEGLFTEFSARKFEASKIPLTAAALHHGLEHLIEPWSRAVDDLGAFYQMANDFFGWRLDYKYGVNTYFLSEARRRRQPDEPIGAWFRREGRQWGESRLRDSLWRLASLMQVLESPGAQAWMQACAAMVEERLRVIAVTAVHVPDLLPRVAAPRSPVTELSGT